MIKRYKEYESKDLKVGPVDNLYTKKRLLIKDYNLEPVWLFECHADDSP